MDRRHESRWRCVRDASPPTLVTCTWWLDPRQARQTLLAGDPAAAVDLVPAEVLEPAEDDARAVVDEGAEVGIRQRLVHALAGARAAAAHGRARAAARARAAVRAAGGDPVP